MALALQGHENDRRCRREPFVPTGERIVLRGFDDARSHDPPNDLRLGGNQLFAQRLGVGVNVGPAPERRAFDAKFSQTIARPDFSFSSDSQTKRIRIVGVSQFFVETFAGLFTKLRQTHRVLCFFARAFRHLGTVGDFLLNRKVNALQFLFARKITNHGIVFPNRAGSIAGDEACRDVNQTWPLHSFGEGNHVLRSNHVRAQSTFQGWIESYVAG